MAEFQRALIQERVKAGLRNAGAKGKRLGCPPAEIDEAQIEKLRAAGASWRTIAEDLGVGLATAYRIAQACSKNVCGPIPESKPEVLKA